MSECYCAKCIYQDTCRFMSLKYIKIDCRFFKDKSLFVELPCKVGDVVYVPWHWAGAKGVASVKVEEIKFYDTNTSHYMFLIDMESDDESFNQSFGGWKIKQSIGETVFLTKEEADQKLKEIK